MALLSLLTGFASLNAQVVEFNFIVVDSQSNPISDAFILLSTDIVGGQTLGSAVSDDLGRASAKVTLDRSFIVVQVQQLSYYLFNNVVEVLDTSNKQEVRVVLKSKSYALEEATVSAQRKYAEISNNDTIQLNIESRRDSTEKNIMELLAKAPGMRQLPNGKLQYRGKNISRVKIDNKDVFGQNGYSKALSQIRPDIVEDVDVIQNNHEDAVLSRLQQSNETILNITTDTSATNKVVGEIAAILGISAKSDFSYDNNANVLLLDKKNGVFGQITHSNFGNFVDDVNPISFGTQNANSLDPLDGIQEVLTAIPDGYTQLDQFQVAPQLIGDARIVEGTVSWIHQLDNGSSSRVQIKLGDASDKFQDNTLGSLIDNVSAFSLQTESSQSVSRQGGAIGFEYKGLTDDPLISYRIKADLKGNRLNSNVDIRQFDGAASPPTFFPSTSNMDAVTGNFGVRLNIATSKTSALQLFGDQSFGNQSQIKKLDLDSSLVDVVAAFSQSQAEGFNQNQDVNSKRLKLGLKYLYRSTIGLGELYLDHTKTDRSATLKYDDSLEDTGHTSRTIVKAGGKLTSKIISNWILGARVEFLASRIPASQTRNWRPDYSYSLFLRQQRGSFENYILQFNRSLIFATLPYLPGVFLVQDPFTAYQQQFQNTPSAIDKISLSGREGFFDNDILINGKLNYSWRIREGQNELKLDDDVQSQRQNVIIDGQSFNSSVFIENTSVKYGYTIKLFGHFGTSLFESNLVGVSEKRSVTSFLYGFNLQLPRIGNIYTTINALNERVKVEGAFASKNRSYTFSMNLKYKRKYWFTQVQGKIKLADASSISLFSSYSSIDASVNYYLRPDDRNSPEISFHLQNLFAPSNFRNIHLASPLITEYSIQRLPALVRLGIQFPFGA